MHSFLSQSIMNFHRGSSASERNPNLANCSTKRAQESHEGVVANKMPVGCGVKFWSPVSKDQVTSYFERFTAKEENENYQGKTYIHASEIKCIVFCIYSSNCCFFLANNVLFISLFQGTYCFFYFCFFFFFLCFVCMSNKSQKIHKSFISCFG